MDLQLSQINNLCEFSDSFSDCVIFHAKSLFESLTTHVSALTFVIHDDDSNSDENSIINVDDTGSRNQWVYIRNES